MTRDAVGLSELAALLICALSVLRSAPAHPAAEQTKLSSPAKALHALFREAWERDLRDDPLAATYYGDHHFDYAWPDLSPNAIQEREAAERATLGRVRAIDRSALTPEDQLNARLFERVYRDRVAMQPFKPWLYSLFSRDGLQTLNETTELIAFDKREDYDHWLSRLRSLKTYLAQSTALLQMGISEHRMQARAVLERSVKPLAALAQPDVDSNPFYAPFKHMPESIPAAERTRLAEAARTAIKDDVIPAYQRLNAFFLKQVLPAARAHEGIWDTPDGPAFYRERIAYYTTTDLTADQIHAIGLAEVKRIRAEMDRVITQMGFKGSFAAFLTFLRTDPQFYYRTPQELLDGYRAVAKRIDPELVKLFGHLPRTPYGVRPIPDTSAPNTTTAYYQGPAADGTRPGYFCVNLFRPEVRPKYEMEVLTSHEAVPGHHLQIAIASELTDLPEFRRDADFTAFVEGWGLYAESLGDDLGLYTDPYSRFGKLTYEMWRALRLVVDTGLHEKHWTRAQAIDYIKANAAKTEADIINEVDRYIAWPGQALAYKIGELRFKALRAQSQRALGAEFDMREFHDTLLGSGPLPMDVLEDVVHDWIKQKQSAAASRK